MRSVVTAFQQLRARRWARWVMDALFVVAIFMAVNAWQTRHHTSGDAPAFSLVTLEGELIAKEDLVGKPTLLVFWAPWCRVCELESRNVSWVQSFVGARARVLSIASEYDDVDAVRDYVARNNVDYPVLLGGSQTARAYRVGAFPSAYFLDEEGRVTASVVGYTSTAGLLLRLLL